MHKGSNMLGLAGNGHAYLVPLTGTVSQSRRATTARRRKIGAGAGRGGVAGCVILKGGLIRSVCPAWILISTLEPPKSFRRPGSRQVT